MISQSGLTFWIAAPARSAAACQSVAALPSPHVGLTMRLVVQVGRNDRGIALVALGQHHPVIDPVLFGKGAVVPQAVLVRAIARMAAMMVQDDPHPELPRIIDDPVDDFEARQPGQIRI